jgi:hypothetical protein
VSAGRIEFSVASLRRERPGLLGLNACRTWKTSTLRELLKVECAQGVSGGTQKGYKSSGGIVFCFSVGAGLEKSTQSEGGEVKNSSKEENRRLGAVE